VRRKTSKKEAESAITKERTQRGGEVTLYLRDEDQGERGTVRRLSEPEPNQELMEEVARTPRGDVRRECTGEEMCDGRSDVRREK
jgi:hypothetical protein